MTSGQWWVYAAGAHSLALAAFHAGFWRLFRWREDLRGNSVATRAIVQILNLRLIYVFLGVAALCFCLPRELLDTRLGHAVLGGMVLFWVGRVIEQFVFLRYNHVSVHALTVVFAAGAVLFAVPLCVR